MDSFTHRRYRTKQRAIFDQKYTEKHYETEQQHNERTLIGYMPTRTE